MAKRSSSEAMNGGDPGEERLDVLLGQWQGVEPQANFEAGVWRRIRAAQATAPAGHATGAFWRSWLSPDLAWASAAAAVLAVLFGAWVGVSRPAGGAGGRANEPLLHPRTLAGSYLAMVTGDHR